MRYVAFALATTTALFAGGMLMSGGAQAAPPGASNGLGAAADKLDMVENTQFVFGGRRYCWYDGGWQGPGWYWCGYGSRRGLGWGGGHGWQGWHSQNRVGRDFGVRRRGGQFQDDGQVQRGQVQRAPR